MCLDNIVAAGCSGILEVLRKFLDFHFSFHESMWGSSDCILLFSSS